MSMWRCPHCATPQSETARCWVCHRSSTTCSTCRHFRRSVAAQVGFCGLDRRRLPLAGSEHRGCWEDGSAQAPDAATGDALKRLAPHDPENGREFIPVPLGRDRIGPQPTTAPDGARSALPADQHADAVPATSCADTQIDLVAVDRWTNRVTLFGELDR